jgi:hypothetical protein
MTACPVVGRGKQNAAPQLLAVVSHQLHDQMYLAVSEERLDAAHDAGLAANLDLVAHLERRLAAQVAGRDHVVAAPQFVAIIDPSHRGFGEYAPAASMNRERGWW